VTRAVMATLLLFGAGSAVAQAPATGAPSQAPALTRTRHS
jgi:hypothetical protein